MTAEQATSAPESKTYSVPAILAAVVGVTGLLLTGSQLIATLLSLAGIALALYARRQLKRTPQHRGFALSLIGFLAGLWVLVTTGVPYVYFTVLVALN